MEQKHTNREEYLKLFCENQRVSRRSVICLSKETHRKLSSLAYLFYEEQVSMASLADNIIRLHIEAHIELLKKEAERKTSGTYLMNCRQRVSTSVQAYILTSIEKIS